MEYVISKGYRLRKGGKVMNLELTDTERDKLIKALDYFITELRGEIASGVKHDWKVEMKQEESTLKEVLQKLKQLK